MSDVVYVDENNFETEVLKSEMPVLVDFSATWCGPCQRQMPIVEKFATENLNKVKVCKIDVDESPAIASKFGIKGVPTMLVFQHGEKKASQVGLTTLDTLRKIAFGA
jgi:thioredoxin 1